VGERASELLQCSLAPGMGHGPSSENMTRNLADLNTTEHLSWKISVSVFRTPRLQKSVYYYY